MHARGFGQRGRALIASLALTFGGFRRSSSSSKGATAI
jgi:hypothetical protein